MSVASIFTTCVCTVYRVVYYVCVYRVPCRLLQLFHLQGGSFAASLLRVYRVPCTVYRVPCTVYRVPCTLRLLLYLHGGSFAVASILAMTTDDTLLISVASCCERKIFTKKKDYICVHAHTHAHIHTQTHKHTHTHIHKHTHVHINIYILYTHLVDNWRELPTHTHTHTHTHTDTHTHSLSHTP